MRPESTALNVMDRIDALAKALRDAGVSPELTSGLLASAATAAMHAVTLDALIDEPSPPRAQRTEPRVELPERLPQAVRLAA